MHSTESDGTLTPVELIAAAKEAGLSAIALTDHDTCSGIKKAAEAAANAGIELVPGIELSTADTFPNGTEKFIRFCFVRTVMMRWWGNLLHRQW